MKQRNAKVEPFDTGNDYLNEALDRLEEVWNDPQGPLADIEIRDAVKSVLIQAERRCEKREL